MSKTIHINQNMLRQIVAESVRQYLSESRNPLSNIIWIAYGTDKFDSKQSRPVDFYSLPCRTNNKPYGGVWASPLESKWGWADFCDSEEFRLRTLDTHYLFKLSPDAKIYVIDTFEDLKRVSTRYIQQDLSYGIDFPELGDKYNGIYVTYNAARTLRYPGNGILGLQAWDVESICIWDDDVIIPIEEDAFEKASVNKHEKPAYDDEEISNSRKNLQMASDYDKYGNRNINKNMGQFFKGGKHPAISAQGHGNSKETKLARKFDGTIKSGMK